MVSFFRYNNYVRPYIKHTCCIFCSCSSRIYSPNKFEEWYWACSPWPNKNLDSLRLCRTDCAFPIGIDITQWSRKNRSATTRRNILIIRYKYEPLHLPWTRYCEERTWRRNDTYIFVDDMSVNFFDSNQNPRKVLYYISCRKVKNQDIINLILKKMLRLCL